MRRILIILLLWSMTFLAIPGTEAKPSMAQTQTMAAIESYGHTECYHCPDRNAHGAAGHLSCSHAGLCLLCALGGTQTEGLNRAVLPAGFPSSAAAWLLPHAPALDLPPPRTGSAFA